MLTQQQDSDAQEVVPLRIINGSRGYAVVRDPPAGRADWKDRLQRTKASGVRLTLCPVCVSLFYSTRGELRLRLGVQSHPYSHRPGSEYIGMRRLKHKKTRRAMRFYRINHSFRPPYKVLLDGNFVHAVEALK